MTSESRQRQENEEPIDLLPSLQYTALVQKNDDNEQETRENEHGYQNARGREKEWGFICFIESTQRVENEEYVYSLSSS